MRALLPLDIQDWIRTDAEGRGMINVLDSVKLVQNPTLYATFLLWLLSELFESLPESGDMDKPRLVFFFDEAHMLFRDVPKVLLQKIEQTVKLIRSQGVGEALTSFLDEEGVPTIVERTKIICPQSSMAPPDPMFRSKAMLHDGMEKYDDYVDNESAYEVLTAEAVKAEAAAEEEADRKIREKEEAAAKKRLQKLEDEERRRQQKLEDQALRKKERQQEKAEADARRRADRIEAELLAVGASVLTRGLLGVLQNQSKK